MYLTFKSTIHKCREVVIFNWALDILQVIINDDNYCHIQCEGEVKLDKDRSAVCGFRKQICAGSLLQDIQS